ncbi:MAG: rod shape-determining protein MreD [Eubacteriales bacterium]|nr:rod shape-determining protein MreD [Eubacteriales bacterium]
MKKNIYLVLLSIVFLFLDTAFFDRINLYGIRPYMVLALALSATLTFSVQSGIIIAAVCGLVLDFIGNPYLGLTSALYLAAVVVCYVLVGRSNHKKLFVFLIMVTSLIAMDMLLWLLATIFGAVVNVLNALLLHAIPCAIITGGLTMLLNRCLSPLLKGQLERA